MLQPVIVGIGQSRVGRVADRSTAQLHSDAVQAALADAGLTRKDIDGLFTTPLRVEHWQAPAAVVANNLGLSPRYMATVDLAGASGAAMVQQAVAAVANGYCTTALCVAGQNLLSHRTRADAVKSMAESGSAHSQFEVPYGPVVPSLYALVAQRHMHQYGTTSEQMAEVAVALRGNAALNPAAHKQDPITVADVLASRVISTPLHMLDCAIVSDGAGALIVTTWDRARDLNQKPVHLIGAGVGMCHSHIGEAREPVVTGAVLSGRQAFGAAGLTPTDVDVAELYDCFSITVLIELEDLGFCAKGEGGPFVMNGRIRRDGALPITTHGGLMSFGHPGVGGGLFHVLEAVCQLRGDAGERQVDNVEVALAHGNGGVMSVHCTLLLAKESRS
jgi:acetyl-CoA acetyltransferase